MTKKLEYADVVYYCRVKKNLQNEAFDEMIDEDGGWIFITNTECKMSPTPDCRKCIVRKKNEWIFDRSLR